MIKDDSTSNNKHKLTSKEIKKLASVIVPSAHRQPKYTSDEVALALIRLVAGIAGGDEDERFFVMVEVALGCFQQTSMHGRAMDEFIYKGRQISVRKLTRKGRG